MKKEKSEKGWQKAVFILLVLFCLSPFSSPLIALVLGLAFAIGFGSPFSKLGVWPTILLQASIVLVGFGIDPASATTFGLMRELWMVPVAFWSAFTVRRDAGLRAVIPWFIILLVFTVAFRKHAPPFIFPSVFDAIVNFGNAGIVVALFLTGAGFTRETLRNIEPKLLILGFLVWTIISAASLFVVLRLL